MTFNRYHKIKQLGDEDNEGIFSDPEDEIVIQEKIDGANFRFMIKDGQIIFGSRTRELDEKDKAGKGWNRCVMHILEAQGKNPGWYREGCIYYGECCTPHTMPYDRQKMPPFLGFDIYNIEDVKYLHWSEAQAMFFDMGLAFVPVILDCTVKSIMESDINDDLVPISVYAHPESKDQQAEGIVFKNHKKQLMAKYVREKFKESAKDLFGGSPKRAKTDNNFVIAKWCLNARIDKCIFKLVDEDHKLEMPLMKHLPTMVYADMMEEHWKEITSSKLTIDFGKLKSQMSKRCVAVLKNVMVNNEAGVGNEIKET